MRAEQKAGQTKRRHKENNETMPYDNTETKGLDEIILYESFDHDKLLISQPPNMFKVFFFFSRNSAISIGYGLVHYSFIT